MVFWSPSSLVALQAALHPLQPLHLGKLHAYEHVLVWLLAFGPVLLLAVTVHIARKRSREEEQAPASERPEERRTGAS